MYYRVINPMECISDPINSREFQQYPRKKRTIELFESYKWVCWLAEKTKIRLSSAITIAKQYGWVIKQIQDMEKNSEVLISLDLFLVFNDPIKEIPMNDLVFFINNYNAIYEKTGIYIDDGDEFCVWEFIWELVRQQVSSELPSRLFSCYLFDNLFDAENFKKEKYNQNNKIVKIDFVEKRNISKFDMNWLSDVPVTSTFSDAYEYAYNYWQQKETDNPLWEYLCDSTYLTIEID